MEGNNKIIERIIKDAQDKCNDIAAQAEKKRDSLIEANNTRLALQRREIEENCIAQCREIKANTMANADLDIRKLRLKLKRELLDEVYSGAYQDILNQPTDKYLAFISSLLKAHAEKGEVVDIAKRDEKAITQAFLDKLNLGLKLNKVVGIEGGVILRGKGYDKNLSIEALFSVVRENTEIEVARVLFS